VKRWTKSVDIFQFEKILIPIHLHNHWALVVIDFKQQQLQYYDPLQLKNQRCLQNVALYLCREWEVKKGRNGPTLNSWRREHINNIPFQTNTNDCGVFVLEYGRCIIKDLPFNFTSNNLPSIRKRIYSELLEHSNQ